MDDVGEQAVDPSETASKSLSAPAPGFDLPAFVEHAPEGRAVMPARSCSPLSLRARLTRGGVGRKPSMRLFFRSGRPLGRAVGAGSAEVDGVDGAGATGVPSGDISASARAISWRAMCRPEKALRFIMVAAQAADKSAGRTVSCAGGRGLRR